VIAVAASTDDDAQHNGVYSARVVKSWPSVLGITSRCSRFLGNRRHQAAGRRHV
jgi:hypothetical protein